MTKFEKNLATGVEFEDFVDYSGLLYDLFGNDIGYIDCRNHTLDTINRKGPRLKYQSGKSFELPDFQIYQNNKMFWVEAKSKPSGSFEYRRFGGEYYSLDRSKYNGYEQIVEFTQADELYFLFGDLKNNLIYLYKKLDFRDWAELRSTGFSPLYPAIDKFLVAKIINYSDNEYILIK